MPADFDLAIAGAGPAGCAAAITATSAGARVILLERGRYPRNKVCGEFVSPEGLTLLQGLDAPLARELLDAAPRIARARLFLGEDCVEVPIVPAAASVTRFALDHALWRAAIRAGVDCRELTAVTAVREGFVVATAAGSFRVHSVIVAAGRWSNLQANAHSLSRDTYIAFKAHYSEQKPVSSVDLYFFPDGYCGVQPVSDGVVNVCAMVRSAAARTLQEVFQLEPGLCNRSHGWALTAGPVSTAPLVFARPVPRRGHVLYAGDAAGFIDPFIGDGISLALRSGKMAAQCLAQVWSGEISSDRAALAYAARFHQELAPLFRTAALLRRTISMKGPLKRTALSMLRLPKLAGWLLKNTRSAA